MVFLAFLFHSCAHVGENVLPVSARIHLRYAGTEGRVLSLNPDAISEREVAEVLSKCPAPRVFSLDGSVPIVTMESFGRFLVRMGYPEASIRNPRNGSYSYSSYRSSAEMAGMVAWYYEKEGMRPMVIGHSQGGMLSVKILHELAGAFREEIEVTNPYTEQSENRYLYHRPLEWKRAPCRWAQTRFCLSHRDREGGAFRSGTVEYAEPTQKDPGYGRRICWIPSSERSHQRNPVRSGAGRPVHSRWIRESTQYYLAP